MLCRLAGASWIRSGVPFAFCQAKKNCFFLLKEMLNVTINTPCEAGKLQAFTKNELSNSAAGMGSQRWGKLQKNENPHVGKTTGE